jgi:enoyl-CoA hydratase/carnithine racemase
MSSLEKAATVVLERSGRVAVATLNRPPVNAINEEMLADLEGILEEISGDDGISVLHIRSGQKVFCAGADLGLMQSCFDGPAGTEGMVEVVKRMQRVYARIEAEPLLTIAEMGGAAMGGGLELALACDLRVAANEAMMGLVEVQLGLVPGAGGTQRLMRLCGRGVASRMILGGEVIDGTLAERLGVVQWAQPRAELAEWTRELAERLSAAPRAALAANKRCIAFGGDAQRAGYAEEIAATRELYANAESRRRVAEFLKRHAK